MSAWIAVLIIVLVGALPIIVLEVRSAKRMRAFKERIREIHDRAKREMRAAASDAELDEIVTRAKDEIEDLEL